MDVGTKQVAVLDVPDGILSGDDYHLGETA
jgi:hypothetical protein